MTKMEKLKDIAELQTIGGLLLDIEVRNGKDDTCDMNQVEEIPIIEIEDVIDEESPEELIELVGDEEADGLICEELAKDSELLSENEVVDLLDEEEGGEELRSLDELVVDEIVEI